MATGTQIKDAVDTGSLQVGPTSMKEDADDAIHINVFNHEHVVQMVKVIDKFREDGLEKDISLPQLVVAGNQSAGKSSLLESLTNLPFPVGIGICTRFATQVNLRRSKNASTVASLVNFDSPSYFPKTFKRGLTASSFAQLIKDASDALELPTKAQQQSPRATNTQAFANSTLNIEVSGPDQHFLSFVDTPGLFHARTRAQTCEDAEKISSLVSSYMADPRTIIVAVMDSRHEPATQSVFTLVERADPSLARTVGVLTKCDYLSSSPGELSAALRIVKNNDVRELKHGWFVVKNKSQEDRESGLSHEQALANEDEFFKGSDWNGISPERKGTRQLTRFLSSLFARHVSSEFPKLVKEMHSKLDAARKELAALGPARSTPEQQRNFLVDAAQKCQSFLNQSRTTGFTYTRDPRAQIWLHLKNLEQRFTETINGRGCARPFHPIAEGNLYDKVAGRSRADLPDLRTLEDEEKEDIYSWINRQYHESSGPECCFLAHPHLVNQIFEAQTIPWRQIAHSHIEDVAETIEDLVACALESCCKDRRIAHQLTEHFSASLTNARLSTLERADQILHNETRRIRIQDDDAFAKEIYKARAARLEAALRDLLPRDIQSEDAASRPGSSKDPGQVFYDIGKGPRTIVYEIHDLLSIYYKIALARFKDNIIQLGDSLILNEQSSLYGFNPEWVHNLSDADLALYGGEDEHTAEERYRLTDKVARLQRGLEMAAPVLRASRATSARQIPPDSTPAHLAPAPARSVTPSAHPAPQPITPLREPADGEMTPELWSSFSKLSVSPSNTAGSVTESYPHIITPTSGAMAISPVIHDGRDEIDLHQGISDVYSAVSSKGKGRMTAPAYHQDTQTMRRQYMDQNAHSPSPLPFSQRQSQMPGLPTFRFEAGETQAKVA